MLIYFDFVDIDFNIILDLPALYNFFFSAAIM